MANKPTYEELEQRVKELEKEAAERNETEEELQESKRLIELLLDSLPHSAMLIRSDRTVLAANRIAREFGAKVGGYCWRDFGQSDFIPERDKEYINQHKQIPPGVTCCYFCKADEALESKCQTQNEVKAWGKVWNANWIPLSEDTYLQYVIDITERKRAEAERLEMERRLLHAQKLESLGVLAGGIAHDFNNLLTAILGNLDIALLNLSPISRARHNIEQAMLASRRAADLTQQMLVYSGKGQLVVRNIDLSELVKENEYLFRASTSKTATLNLRLVSNLPAILADPEQVQQVIMNLITNASEAIGEKPGMISLSTGVQECDEAYLRRSRIEEKPLPGKYVYVEVSDTGCGMEEEISQRLFDPFFTTKFTGRGLGMSAVQGIVRGHKGAIFVDSGVGKGTTIRVLFPVSETGGRERAEVDEAEGLRLGEADRTSMSGTVLVVDDEEMVCGLCKGMLEYLGFHVFTAADGQEALDVFQKHADEVVCVILDLTMPRMDGVATFRELRRIRPDVRVILSSGYHEQDATRRFVGEGLSGFIQKPYRLKDLREKIAWVLK